MGVKYAALLACALMLAAAAVRAQAPAAAAPPAERPAAPEPASFDVQIQAPDAVRALLERHMQLQRYRAVSDLDARELEQLLTMARKDIEELLGTLGFFKPQIELRLIESSALPVIEVRVEPGPITRVRSVRLQFEGALEQDGPPALSTLRQRIERGWRLPVGRPFTQSQWDEAKNQALRELFKNPEGRTLAQALALYQASCMQGAAPIQRQFQFNQHIRDYFAQHPGATRAQALQAWHAKRQTPQALVFSADSE